MDRLERAKQYIAKGDDFYAKAADDIIAAMEEDTTLSYRQVAERVGKSPAWVSDIVKWRTSVSGPLTPFAEKDAPGERNVRATRQVLREADDEQLLDIVSQLPSEQQTKLADAISQAHPATSSKAPIAMSHSKAGFVLELAGPSAKLKNAAEQFTKAWEENVGNASEDHKQLVRDDIAPALFGVQLLTQELVA